MGAEAFLVASTTNVIIAQRLVRKLCQECKEEYHLDEKEIKTLSATFDMDEMLGLLKKTELLKGIVTAKSTWKDISFYKAKGCEQCKNEGHKGRCGIYEVLEVDTEIGKMINENATSKQIEDKARENGMLTMSEDGFVKAVQGTTSIEEILRVTKE
jgi:type II secretory ATPase GspE/PulE/Tfp pilus assembly ATPase PilB-like protein